MFNNVLFGVLTTTPVPIEKLADLFTGENALDVTVVYNQIYALLPYVMPAVLGFIGFRKGLGWLMGQIRGA